MRIAWLSNPPWSCSGYGVQTKLFVPRLAALGHEVTVLANCGLGGGVLNYGPVRVFPTGFNGTLTDGLVKEQLRVLEADIVLTLYDAWAFEPSFFGATPWIPWFMCDREPMPEIVMERIVKSFLPISCSSFGLDCLDQYCKRHELDNQLSAYIPLAVDSKAFYLEDPAEARDRLKIPQEAYTVVIVADNKGWPTRKNLAGQIQAFAEFVRRRGLTPSEACLYLHTCITGARGGLDLRRLIDHLNIGEYTKTCHQEMYQMGFNDDYMRMVYNSANVLLNVSMDEGFGVPIVEAQMCGVPAIVGDWTAMKEVTSSGYAVHKEQAERQWNPSVGFQYLAHEHAVADLLERAMDTDWGAREFIRSKVMRYDVDRVIEGYMIAALEAISNLKDSTDATK